MFSSLLCKREEKDYNCKKKTTTATSTILTVDGVGLSISNALSGPASAAGPS